MVEYKVGDVLTLKVPVVQGRLGPIIKIAGSPLPVPGHPDWEVGGVYVLDESLIVGCERPLHVGDKVYVKSRSPTKYDLIRPAIIMAELPDEPDIFMVQYDRYKNYWYRKHRSELTKDTNQ